MPPFLCWLVRGWVLLVAIIPLSRARREKVRTTCDDPTRWTPVAIFSSRFTATAPSDDFQERRNSTGCRGSIRAATRATILSKRTQWREFRGKIRRGVLEGRFASGMKRYLEIVLLKQRHGMERIARSARNVAGVVLGVWMAFAGGLSTPPPLSASTSLTAPELSLVLQCGMLAWVVVDDCLTRHCAHRADVKNDTATFVEARGRNDKYTTHAYYNIAIGGRDCKGNDPTSSTDHYETTGVATREARSPIIGHNVLFNDGIAVVVALLVLLAIKRNPHHKPHRAVFQMAVFLICIFRVTVRSFRSIVDDVLYVEHTRRNSILYRYLLRRRRASLPDVSNLQKRFLEWMAGFLVLAALSCVSSSSNAPLLPMVAASLMGATLVADSVVDEVVNNWFDLLLRRLGRNQRNAVVAHIVTETIQESLSDRVFGRLREAFQEFEDMVKGSVGIDGNSSSIWSEGEGFPKDGKRSDSNLSFLHDHTKKAISKNTKLQMVWTLAASGVLTQLFILWREPIGFVVREALLSIHSDALWNDMFPDLPFPK